MSTSVFPSVGIFIGSMADIKKLTQSDYETLYNDEDDGSKATENVPLIGDSDGSQGGGIDAVDGHDELTLDDYKVYMYMCGRLHRWHCTMTLNWSESENCRIYYDEQLQLCIVIYIYKLSHLAHDFIYYIKRSYTTVFAITCPSHGFLIFNIRKYLNFIPSLLPLYIYIYICTDAIIHS